MGTDNDNIKFKILNTAVLFDFFIFSTKYQRPGGISVSGMIKGFANHRVVQFELCHLTRQLHHV